MEKKKNETNFPISGTAVFLFIMTWLVIIGLIVFSVMLGGSLCDFLSRTVSALLEKLPELGLQLPVQL